MKNLFLLFTLIVGFISIQAQNNPFAEYGYTPKVATLSQGQFNESFDNDTIVQIGSVLFNPISKQIVGFVEYDTLYSEATLEPDIVSRWMSPDPLAHEYAGLSPYNFVANNPIRLVDADGRYIVDPATKKPVVQVNGEWKTVTVNKDGTKSFGQVSERFNTQTKPILDILQKSEVGRNNIAYMQAIPTLITIDPDLHDPKPGDNSTVEPTSNKLVKQDGKKFYESVNIIPDMNNISEMANKNGLNLEEKISGVLAVEVGHLRPNQIKIDQGNSTFAEQYNGLLNDHIRAQISYRQENGIGLDESLFTPTDQFKEYGFKLDSDLQKVRDNL
jgi:hypothetical protein